MKRVLLFCFLYLGQLPAMDGPGYETIFSQVQNALGVSIVTDRVKLMAESIVTFPPFS